ncbi:MAG: hypothetical protein M3R09_00230, partial [Actinomycetota bacterium]|nr:hypothetical protein [Actinomycetota bacterium]
MGPQGPVFEEAEEVVVHARDPRHRVDVIPSDRRVVVARDGDVLADSRRPCALFETTLPTRWWSPQRSLEADLNRDPRPGLLRPGATLTSSRR